MTESYCKMSPTGGTHHWHEATEPISPNVEKGLPMKVCCFCGLVVFTVAAVHPGCGPHVEPRK
jgi:hypothetical protein